MKRHSYKLNWEHLKSKTPKLARRIGNTLLSLSTFIAGYELYNGNEKIGAAAFILGILGKFLISFFKQNDNTDENGN